MNDELDFYKKLCERLSADIKSIKDAAREIELERILEYIALGKTCYNSDRLKTFT